MTRNTTTGTRNTTTGLLIFGLIAFAILGLAVLLSSAMEAGGWMFIGLIIGLVVVVGLILWAGAFVVRQYVMVRDKRDTFILEMSRLGYTHPRSGWSRANQLTAPAPSSKPIEIDPRHDLLVALCLATIRSDGYGPSSERLLTCDDAQSRGGRFADRNNWDTASKYGQDIGYLYTKVGGPPKEQGLKINGANPDVAGRTVTDLLEALHSRNSICDAAVAALPGVVR